jgi:hypothetical protein
MYEVGFIYLVLHLIIATLILIRSFVYGMFTGYGVVGSVRVITLILFLWPIFLVWGILEQLNNRKDLS